MNQFTWMISFMAYFLHEMSDMTLVALECLAEGELE